jgi:nucleoside diphosphate kinase
MKKLSKYFEDMVLSPEPNAFCMLKPGFNQYKDEFERLLNLNGWKIIKHCTKQFTRPEIEDFYLMHKDQGFYNKLCDYMITEACECYSCYKRCKDPYKEMGDFKKKIRDEWGEDEMRNGMHSSDNKDNMIKECNIAFNSVNEKLKVSTDGESAEPDRDITLGELYDTLLEAFGRDSVCGMYVPIYFNHPIYYKGDEKQELMEIRCVTSFEEFRINVRYKTHDGKSKEFYTDVSTYKAKDDLVKFISQEDANEMIKVLHKIMEKKKNK